jgi:hypothetical protein
MAFLCVIGGVIVSKIGVRLAIFVSYTVFHFCQRSSNSNWLDLKHGRYHVSTHVSFPRNQFTGAYQIRR